MSERPTLTVSVPCPTCGGTKTLPAWGTCDFPQSIVHPEQPCPDCTDGAIRQAVSCQSCRWATPIADDEIECALLLMKNSPDWGCLSWEAKA